MVVLDAVRRDAGPADGPGILLKTLPTVLRGDDPADALPTGINRWRRTDDPGQDASGVGDSIRVLIAPQYWPEIAGTRRT
jgi:hypothetical protein